MAALEKITMLLMQKVANKSGFGGAYDVDRWPPNCKAFEFLAEIQVAKTLDQLMQVSWPQIFDVLFTTNFISIRCYDFAVRRSRSSGWWISRQTLPPQAIRIMSRVRIYLGQLRFLLVPNRGCF
jgi:hypothetical protein